MNLIILDRTTLLLAATLVFAAPLGGIGCRRAAAIAVDPPELTFYSSTDTATLRATVRDEDGRVMERSRFFWSSAEPRIAEVSPEGVVTPKKDGRVRLTVSRGSIRQVVPVTVNFYTAIRPSQRRVELKVGQTTRLDADVFISSGAIVPAVLGWSSHNKDVVTVDADGVVTAVAPGKTSIAVSAKHVSSLIKIIVTGEPSS